MQIRRIEIADFRKITHRVIEGLDDGLNIVVGDNEAGKSTMLAALRAVFFERHRVGGAAADAMQPYGGAVRPTVEVEFRLGGQDWRLAKSFCQRPEASLIGPGERLSGDAVEDRLAALFGFTPPGRGGSKPAEHQGTHGLLWVEQGTRDDLGIGAGRDTLAAALESEVGQVTGGERGRALIAAAERRRDRHWDKRMKPRGEIVAQRKVIDELLREQEDLAARQHAHDDRITRLTDLEDKLARHARDDRLVRAVAAVAAALGAVAAADRAGAVVTEAAGRRQEAQRLRGEAQDRHAVRAALVAKCRAAQLDVARLAQLADEADSVARRAAQALREADERAGAARQARETADTRLRAMEDHWERRRAEVALAERRATLEAAEAQAAQRRDAVARSEAITVDADAIKAILALERADDQARAELAAASVQLVFEPEGSRSVSLDGVPHDTGQPLRLARDTAVELEGFGRVQVRPGGGVALLGRRAEAAAAALRAALERHRVDTVEQAHRLMQSRLEAQADAASLAKALALLVPKGIDGLRQTVESERVRLAQPLADAMPLPAQIDATAIADERRQGEAARTAEQRAAQDAKHAAVQHATAATDAAARNAHHAAATRSARLLSDELAAARLSRDDDTLGRHLDEAEARFVEESAREARAQTTHDAADPETARLTLERTQRVEAEIRKDVANLERERRDLQVELRAVGQDGIGERLSEIEGALGRERQRLAMLDREAEASRLLHDTLLGAQRDAKDRWLGPVRRRVEPYLRLIHPDSEIRIDDDSLEIEGLLRGGVLERFGSLSMGAREQVAVITRLALADVLRAAGQPAAVILDDALVNTDEGRLERMHNVLTRAARSLQILVFTCRERDFIGLGATHRI